MPWSTPELARLARTTVNTIRHYHRLGLLEEPERKSNGYREYEVRHLVRLLRLRRLVSLGVPLSRVEEFDDGGTTTELLRSLDAELVANIERDLKARADIAALLNDNAPADTPSGFESIATRMSEADTSLMHIYTQLYDDEAIADLRQMAEDGVGALGEEIDALPPDADEETRQRLVDELAPSMVQSLLDHPWLSDPTMHLMKNAQVAGDTFLEAAAALYNPAQLDVLSRASLLAQQLIQRADKRGDAGE